MAARIQPNSDVAYLCRALKAPSLASSFERLAERARAENWTHEEFLAACLEREVAARQSNGGELRIRAARFPARKTLEDFDFDHQRSLKRDVIAHLGALDFVEAKENVVFLGPPGTGKTHLATGISIRACQAGHRVAFATAAEWVDRLAAAHAAGRLHDELRRLGRYPLLVIDEVGYIPFEAAAMIDRSCTAPKSSPSKATATGSKTATSGGCPPTTQRDQRPGPGGSTFNRCH